MNRIKFIGGIYLILSLFGIFGYGMLLWKFSETVLRITAFLSVVAILGLLGWVGIIMLTTPDFGKKDE